jgi:hypothetical protein
MKQSYLVRLRSGRMNRRAHSRRQKEKILAVQRQQRRRLGLKP